MSGNHKSIGLDATWLAYGVFFTLVVAILLVTNWGIIDAVHIEIGDFAANSVLTLRAKRLALLIGHYSRMGFSHPGPALLYVQAAGEGIFYNLLGLVPSPLSGQLVAVIIYNAFWAMLLLRVLAIAIGSLPTALLVASGFILATVCIHPAFFNGPWFPDMFFFPFAILLLSTARLVEGRADMTGTLALSLGFLINGHASFLPILAITLVLALAYNYWVFRNDPVRQVLSRHFLQQHRRDLLRGFLVLGVLLLPLLIVQLLHFPDPLRAYFAVGRGRSSNALLAAVHFVTVYWGGSAHFALGMMTIFILLIYGSVGAGQQRGSYPYTLVAMLLASTAATLFYAKFGVDLLDQVYLASFYYTVPVLLAVVIVLLAWQKLSSQFEGSSVGKWLTVALSVPLLVGFAYRAGQAPDYAPQYDVPAVAEVYDGLEKVANGRRVVLDLVQQNDWGRVWSITVAAEVYALRRGQDLLCVHQNWHILFSPWAQCTAQELVDNPRFIVDSPITAAPIPGPQDFNAAGLAFRRYVPPQS